MTNILTFNVLSSEYSRPNWFPDTDRKYLKPEYRLEKIQNLLSDYLDDHIICLQEISDLWGKKLKTFFSSYGYEFIYVPYCSRMGVSISFPLDKYNLVEYYQPTIGDEINKNFSDNKNEEIMESISDKHKLLLVKLLDVSTKKHIYVATYHMPCKFMKPTLMETHILFCMKFINEIVGEDSVIFCGDFNSKYGENEYNILTDETYWLKNSSPISANAREIIKKYPICNKTFIDSIDRTIDHNKQVTCYNQKDKEVFLIDYILYRNLKVICSSIEQTNLPVPSVNHPSDHFCLTVHFE